MGPSVCVGVSLHVFRHSWIAHTLTNAHHNHTLTHGNTYTHATLHTHIPLICPLSRAPYISPPCHPTLPSTHQLWLLPALAVKWSGKYGKNLCTSLSQPPLHTHKHSSLVDPIHCPPTYPHPASSPPLPTYQRSPPALLPSIRLSSLMPPPTEFAQVGLMSEQYCIAVLHCTH